MRIRFLINKLLPIALIFICSCSHAQLSNGQAQYDLVDYKGRSLQAAFADGSKGIFVRRTIPGKAIAKFHLAALDKMAKLHNFSYDMLDNSLLTTADGDYFVIESMRPIASTPEEDIDYRKHPDWWPHRCAHAVHLTYLVGVVKDELKIIKKNFTQCTAEARLFKNDGEVGYEVKGYSKSTDNPQSILYISKDGNFVKRENGVFKETP